MFTLVRTQDVQIPASLHQLFELIGAPVQPLSSREDAPELLRKLLQLARRVPAGCDHDLGVLHAGPTVLIILELQLKIKRTLIDEFHGQIQGGHWVCNANFAQILKKGRTSHEIYKTDRPTVYRN